MLLSGTLSDPVMMADGSIQVTATVAPGPNDTRTVPTAILRSAAADFFSGSPVLLEQFTLAGTAAGEIDDFCVTDQGIEVTLTVKDDAAAKKVLAGVYRSAALALRVTGRDPATGAIAKAIIYAASLVDRADDPAFLAKAMPAGGPIRNVLGTVGGLEHSLLEIGARLTRYERSVR